MQLVAVPADLVALGVALGATGAGRGNLLEHLRQRLASLALKGRLLGGGPRFIAPRAAAATLAGRGRRRWRGARRRGQQLGLGRRRRHRHSRLSARRPFAGVNGGAIAAQVPDQRVAQVCRDERLMDPFGQTPFGKFLKSAREGSCGRQALARGKPADATQGTVYRQALDQRHRCGEPQYRLGHEGVRQPRPLARRAPDASPAKRRELLNAHPLQGVDDFFQLRRQRPDLVLQLGQQFVLNYVPPLHDGGACNSIHFAGVMMFGFDNLIMPAMAARILLLPFSKQKIPRTRPFARGSKVTFHFYKMFRGEPANFALVSTDIDQTVKAFAHFVPFPLRAKGDSGCSLSMELLSPKGRLLGFIGEGFKPDEEVTTVSRSGGEIQEGKQKATADGKFAAFIDPGVIGSAGGVASFQASGEACEVILNYEWGTAMRVL